MKDLVGQRFGKYRLLQKLGHGGFAEVYLAEYMALRKHVAIKIFTTPISDEETPDFLREARIVASLEHPHIINVFDSDIENHIPYLVMEYASGGSLHERYPKGTRLSAQEIRDYLWQAASGLQFAHHHRIIHRDVKPQNLLLRQDGSLLLSDFGIALVVQSSQLHSTQQIIGTWGYVAPEQIQGRPHFASDQYALAVMVYEWICGERPFQGTTPEVMAQHLSAPPPPLRTIVPYLPVAVEQVVMKALAKVPEDRFESVWDFATAFIQASQLVDHVSLHEDITLPAPKPVTHSRSLLSPSRRAVVVGITTLMMAAAGSAAWVTLANHPSSAKRSLGAPPSGSSQATVGKLLYTHQGDTNGYGKPATFYASWSPDGKRIASMGFDEVHLWDALSGTHPFTYTGHHDAIYHGVWSSDGRRIATAGADKTVQLWDATDGKHISTYQGHTGYVYSATWSPGGKLIASASGDNTVQVWSAI